MNSTRVLVRRVFAWQWISTDMRHAERTKSRPLASGRVSYRSACLYALAQMVFATGVFYVSLNELGFITAMVQLLPL
jgi:4-hydroxybenzoate polyprenyltransferase